MNTSEPKPIKLSREFARKGEKWHIGVEDRHSASWDGDHYDLKWRSFDTDAELLGHLQQVFKRMEDDGWS